MISGESNRPSNPTDSTDLAAEIAAAAKLTRELTALLNLQTRLIDSGRPQPEELAAAKTRLTSARERVMRRLEALSAAGQPPPADPRALIELAGLDAELTLSLICQRIAAEPDNIELLYHRAVLFNGRSEFALARTDFLAVLRRNPAHLGALIDFGNLLFDTGFIGAAKTLYQQAAAVDPRNLLARVNLANLLHSRSEYAAAILEYQAALELEPESAEAHQGLSYALSSVGEETAAAVHRELGFRNHAVMRWPCRGPLPGLPVLLLCSALGGNIELKTILAAGNFAATLVFTEYFDPNQQLPPHGLAINAIGDADLCREGLEAAQALLRQTTAPVINQPAIVAGTGRIEIAARLAKLPSVRTARTVSAPRRELLDGSAARGFQFPLLVRSPGFHTGQFFTRIDDPGELPAALNELPGEELLVMEWLDARDRQGDFHKFRVMFVDGMLYPLHRAVSKHWKVHYFSAHMDQQADARRLESEFLNDMAGFLGINVMQSLGEICKILNLDYAGIDFALSGNGDILLFEANAAMIVPYPEMDEKWRYRQKPVETIHEAVRKMLSRRLPGARDRSDA